MISKELGIDYDKVLEMTVAEVDAYERSKLNEEVEQKMKNEEMRRKIEFTLPYFNFLYENLGECLFRSFFQNDEKTYFCYEKNKIPGVDYDDPEIKKLLYDEKRETSSVYNRGPYLKMENSYVVTEIIEQAIMMRFPVLTKYNPNLLGMEGDEGPFRNIYLTIRNGKDEKKFVCSMKSLLKADWEQMLEDYLDCINFHKIKTKDAPAYKETNDFLNSAGIAELISSVDAMKKSIQSL